jgi:hypothetical protein
MGTATGLLLHSKCPGTARCAANLQDRGASKEKPRKTAWRASLRVCWSSSAVAGSHAGAVREASGSRVLYCC